MTIYLSMTWTQRISMFCISFCISCILYICWLFFSLSLVKLVTVMLFLWTRCRTIERVTKRENSNNFCSWFFFPYYLVHVYIYIYIYISVYHFSLKLSVVKLVVVELFLWTRCSWLKKFGGYYRFLSIICSLFLLQTKLGKIGGSCVVFMN